MKLLDENGFVFWGNDMLPYLCRMWGSQPWFFYWHKHQKSWVSLKAINGMDVMMANESRMNDKDSKIYNDLSDEFTP